MGKRRYVLCLTLMLMTFSMIPQIMDGNTVVKADITNQELLDWLEAFETSINAKLDAIEDSIGYNTSVSLHKDIQKLKTELANITTDINGMNLTDLVELNLRLDMVDDMLSKINDRIGYPDSKPDANMYDDLSLILDGLTYKKEGVRYWLLKNASGVPSLQIIGENQKVIAEYQLSMNSTFLDALEGAQDDITSKTSAVGKDIKDNQGGTYLLVIIILILVIFFVAWTLFLKERFRPSEVSGFRKPLNEGYGKPSCFGDPNELDPENNPNCRKCRWAVKCQAATIRNAGQTETSSGELEAERNAQGNIVAIYDEGEQIDVPACFGKEYDPQRNKDCQECAINDYCAEQLNKNVQIKIPPMKKAYRQQGASAPSRRIVPARGTVGPTFGEDILDGF